MIYHAYFNHKDGFRVYTIVADNDEEAIRIAKAYDAKYTRVGDRFILMLAGEIIVNEVILREHETTTLLPEPPKKLTELNSKYTRTDASECYDNLGEDDNESEEEEYE